MDSSSWTTFRIIQLGVEAPAVTPTVLNRLNSFLVQFLFGLHLKTGGAHADSAIRDQAAGIAAVIASDNDQAVHLSGPGF